MKLFSVEAAISKRKKICFLHEGPKYIFFGIKGQLISKCLLGVIVSTKKPTKFL